MGRSKGTSLVVVAIAGLLLLASCGSNSDGDELTASDSPVTTTTTTSVAATTSSPIDVVSEPDVTTPTATADSSGENEGIAVLREFIDSYQADDIEGIKATHHPDYLKAPRPFAEPLTHEGFWTWMVRYDWNGEIVGCRVVDDRAVCEDRGTDMFSRALGFEVEINWSAKIEDGLITDLVMNPSDGGVWGANFAWMAQTYPDNPACTAESNAAPMPSPGVPSDEWITECVEFQVLTAPEFGESDSYVAPAELD